MSANLALAGASLFTSLALAKTMGAQGFGELAYALALGGYLLTLAAGGFDQTLLRDLVQRPRLRSRLVSSSLLWRMILLAVGALGLLGVEAFTGLVRPLDVEDWGLILAFALSALTLAPLFDAWGEFRLHTLLYVVERAVYFAVIWGILLLTPSILSVGAVAVALGLAGVVGLVLQAKTALSRFRPTLERSDLWLGWILIKRNGWIWGSALAQLSFGTLSKIVLGNGAGDTALGGYAIAWQVVTVGSLVTAQASRIGNPRLVALVRDGAPIERERFLRNYLLAMIGVAGLVAVPALLAPTPLLGLLGPEYMAAAPAMRILSLYVVLIGVGQVGLQYLIAARIEWAYGVTLLLTALLSMILLSVLVPAHGAVGAAWAVLGSHGLGVVIYLLIMVGHLLKARTARA
ncbi:MAG: oligosaccharide flippase family protein [Gemmatimonadota bacterium]|nr:oligosaccharide flippase family protein [Gemmatimonadota bacterium]MDE3006690.1 oligosaccharide flippase family protein [Gemmatimonadota bacterium]